MKYIIHDEQILTNAVVDITQRFYSGDLFEVNVSDHKENRSSAQRRLQWAWYTQEAKHCGEDKNDIRNRHMYRHGLPIFYRDNINDCVEAIDTIKNLKAIGMVDEYRIMIKTFVVNITSSSFKVAQNHEYLNAVFYDCAHRGVHLFVPDELQGAKFETV